MAKRIYKWESAPTKAGSKYAVKAVARIRGRVVATRYGKEAMVLLGLTTNVGSERIPVAPVEAKRVDPFEAFGLERIDLDAFKRDHLPRIRAYEQRTGRAWLELLLGILDSDPEFRGLGAPEKWIRLVEGRFHEGNLEALLRCDGLARDYGTMTVHQLRKVMQLVTEHTNARYQERAFVGGMITRIPARAWRRAFGFSPSQYDFSRA